jgi:hypothetical protein
MPATDSEITGALQILLLQTVTAVLSISIPCLLFSCAFIPGTSEPRRMKMEPHTTRQLLHNTGTLQLEPAYHIYTNGPTQTFSFTSLFAITPNIPEFGTSLHTLNIDVVAVLAVLAAVSSHHTLTHRCQVCRPWVDMCFLAGFDVTVGRASTIGKKGDAQKMSDPEAARRQSGPYPGTLAVSWDPQSPAWEDTCCIYYIIGGRCIPFNPQYDVAPSFLGFSSALNLCHKPYYIIASTLLSCNRLPTTEGRKLITGSGTSK